MKKLLSLFAFICFWANVNAQYIQLSDYNFITYLEQKYPSCMAYYGRLDTACISNLNIDSISLNSKNIQDLNGIQYFKKLKFLSCHTNNIIALPSLPPSLETLICYENNIVRIPFLPQKLKQLYCWSNNLNSLPKLPDSLNSLYCAFNNLTQLPTLPITLSNFTCNNNQLINLPLLPKKLKYFDCSNNLLTGLTILPDSLFTLYCSQNLLDTLPSLPNSLRNLQCGGNKIKVLQTLPTNLMELDCNENLINKLPFLRQGLQSLNCSKNFLSYLPNLPATLQSLNVSNNPNLYCIPSLPENLTDLALDFPFRITCIPNFLNNAYYMDSNSIGINITPNDVCNPTNNINYCQPFPTIQSFAYTDNNSNNKFNTIEYPKHNLKLRVSNSNHTFTNTQGTAYINADSLGTYTITAQAPPFYKAVPASYTHTFNSYDTLVFLDTSQFIFDSVDNSLASFIGNTVMLTFGNFVPGQTNGFYVYTTVKPTVSLGNDFQATASISSGNDNSSDTANAIIRGSYDPNDKQATPQLSVAQVADNKHWIDYTIRFENTGTDTAFTVVVADTLDDSKLQTNTLQLTGLSHNCKVSQNDKIVYFEFLNINLPDSNTNKTVCNGFVNFRVKPLTTLVNGNIVPNKASIYFDYNEPIITNTAKTIIGNVVPLSLSALGAIPKPENNTILVYWNTANEINTSYFIIEQSTDARTFKSCAEVAAIGKGNNSYYYNIAKNNVQYIRLKMVDKNGTYSYSNIIHITTNDKQDAISIASPTKGILKINVIAASLHNAKASLVNGEGKVVKTFTLKQGYQNIDIATLPSGLYYVQVNDVVRKFVVDR
ncbi:MAG: hypothetical protein NTZ59_02625 [Bacteroidetes bacterium]|nr:hypothetical protein [Bacteroidota bacterium]